MKIEYYDVRPTPRLYVLLLTLSALIVIDVVVNGVLSRDTIVISVLFIGLMFVSRSVTAFSKPFLERLTIRRDFLDPLVEDSELRVRVTIVNDTRHLFPRVEILDKYPGILRLTRGSHVYRTAILPKSTVAYTYVVKTVIGRHVFGPLEMVISDPLKLFSYKVEIETSESSILVRPKPLPVPPRLVHSWAQRGLGLGKSRVKGVGQEFYALREYFPEDDYRFIDWKSYARTNKLHVKLFEREANLSVVFVLDASRSSLRSMVRETPFEYMARVVAGLSRILLSRGDWVCVVVRSTTNLRSGYGRGRKHYYKILETLSKVEWNPQPPVLPIGDLLLMEAFRMLRRTKTLFLVLTTITSWPELESLVNACDKLRSAGHVVRVVQLLPELFELKLLRGVEAGLYYGLSLKEIEASREVRRELARRGVRSLSAGPHDLFETIYLLIEKERLTSA